MKRPRPQAALNALEERPWRESNRGKEMTQNGLARMLKPFKIEPKDLSFDGRTQRGYELEPFTKVFKRYLPGIEVQECEK